MRDGPIGPSPSGATRLARPAASAFEIGAGAERAVIAVQDRDPRLVVGVERAERIGERLGGLAIDRILRGGAIEDDSGDGTLALDANHAANVAEFAACDHGALREVLR